MSGHGPLVFMKMKVRAEDDGKEAWVFDGAFEAAPPVFDCPP